MEKGIKQRIVQSLSSSCCFYSEISLPTFVYKEISLQLYTFHLMSLKINKINKYINVNYWYNLHLTKQFHYGFHRSLSMLRSL